MNAAAKPKKKRPDPGSPRLPRLAGGWRAPALVAVATLLLLLGGFLVWQSRLVLHERAGSVQADRLRQSLVASIGAEIARSRQRVEAVLGDEAVQRAVLADHDAAAVVALEQALPELERAEFYGAAVDEVLNANIARFGYSKAALLMKAKLSGMPVSAEVRSEQDAGPRLAFALPVRTGNAIVAYAVVILPFAPILKIFHAGELSGARLDLRQGDGQGDLLIAGVGDGNGSSARDPGKPIAGSSLRIGKAQPDVFIVVTRNPWLLVPLTLLCLIGGFGALWLRQGGARQSVGRLLRKRRSGPVEVTLAESMQQSAASAAPPVVKPRSTSATPAGAPAAEESVHVDPSIFRSYDIRGVVGASLTPEVARLLGRAIGSEARERGFDEIVVGRDGRLSGPDLVAALIGGLRATGIDVIDIGLAPTPLVYFACFHLNTGSGIAVTGSHNPPEYNGFKIVLGGETLAETAIRNLHERIQAGRFSEGAGGLQLVDVTDDYIARIADDIQIARKQKVVIDCGNGVAGALAPGVLKAIGCDVLPLYCDVDGNFPNHHPDPSDLDNLKDLVLAVKKTGADLGLAFDGDGDRLGVVTKDGEVIFPDRVLMLFAIDVLGRNPGATIIYDVKCTGHLQPLILKHGGSPLMWKTGHSLIKAKMRETGAALAGEMSGHFFFAERWYGFDDGIYSAARLIEILAADPDDRRAEEILAALPKGVSTPELKIPMREGEHYRFIETFKRKAVFDDADLTTIDGIRADWPDGFGLVRASNTTPMLVLRFDADDAAALKRIEDLFRKQLRAIGPDLVLPF